MPAEERTYFVKRYIMVPEIYSDLRVVMLKPVLVDMV